MTAAARTIRAIPEDLRRMQVEASDPAVSAWVTANAGSGKTHVLAQRVIRLLLDGVDPAKILCITFTKAAAANMANRVFDELRRWTALDDGELDAAIKRISDIQPDAARRTLARRLFAMALETPGGLKVQTIHAFCTRAHSAARSRPRSRPPPTRPSRTWSAKRSANATQCAPGSTMAAASTRPSPRSAGRSVWAPTTPSSASTAR